MEPIDEGWVKLHRKLLQNAIFKDSEALHLFIYLLLRANYRQNRFPFNQQEMVIERGQLITGIDQISRDTKLSPWQIRARFKLLENIGIIARKATSRFSIITICNYDYYQSSNNESPQTTHNQATANKNIKERKELNNGLSPKKQGDPRVKGFFDFWGETFSQKTGQPYTFSFGKDGRLLKDLLKVHSFESLQEMTEAFFRDEQCRRRGLTIGIFFQEINRLLSLKSMDPLEQAKREFRQGGAL
jgi:hypothetical protein